MRLYADSSLLVSYYISDANSLTAQALLHGATEPWPFSGSIAVTEQVRAIAKTRLAQNVGQLRPQLMSMISAALKIAMDLP